MILNEVYPLFVRPFKDIYSRFKSFIRIPRDQSSNKSNAVTTHNIDLIVTIKQDDEIRTTVVGLLSLDQRDRIAVVDHLINNTEMRSAPRELRELFLSFKEQSIALRTLHFLND